jgi:hypothetical protein
MSQGNGLPLQNQPKILCIGCQGIESQVNAVINTLGKTMIHVEIAFKCDKCGRMIFTGRIYNPVLYVMGNVVSPAGKVVQ